MTRPSHRFVVRRQDGTTLATAPGFEAAAHTASVMAAESVVIVVHDAKLNATVASFGGVS